MTRVEFYESSFTNCNFLDVDLGAGDFNICKLKNNIFWKSVGQNDMWKYKNVEVWRVCWDKGFFYFRGMIERQQFWLISEHCLF